MEVVFLLLIIVVMAGAFLLQFLIVGGFAAFLFKLLHSEAVTKSEEQQARDMYHTNEQMKVVFGEVCANCQAPRLENTVFCVYCGSPMVVARGSGVDVVLPQFAHTDRDMDMTPQPVLGGIRVLDPDSPEAQALHGPDDLAGLIDMLRGKKGN